VAGVVVEAVATEPKTPGEIEADDRAPRREARASGVWRRRTPGCHDGEGASAERHERDSRQRW